MYQRTTRRAKDERMLIPIACERITGKRREKAKSSDPRYYFRQEAAKTTRCVICYHWSSVKLKALEEFTCSRLEFQVLGRSSLDEIQKR